MIATKKKTITAVTLEGPENARLIALEGCPGVKECPIRPAYVREVTHLINLEKELDRLKKENSLFRGAAKELLLKIREQLLEPIYAMENLLREDLSRIPEVLEANYFIRNKVINIWIQINRENLDAEMRIAEALCSLMRVFQNLRFDFMVIPTYGKKVGILPADSMRVPIQHRGI